MSTFPILLRSHIFLFCFTNRSFCSSFAWIDYSSIGIATPIVIDFDKKDLGKVKKGISNILKSKKLKTKQQVKHYFEPISKDKIEIEELVDGDGNLTGSRIPPLNQGLSPRQTTDQTVAQSRMPGNPLMGYKKYYNESSENDEQIVNEIDYSEAFGYEETKDMDGKETYRYLVKKMGMTPDDAKERVKQFGKDYTGNRAKNAPKKIRDKKGFTRILVWGWTRIN